MVNSILCFWDSDLHLSKTGYLKFASSLFNCVSLCNISRNHFYHYRNPTSTFQPRKTCIMIMNILISLSIFINHFYTVYMFMKFLCLYLLCHLHCSPLFTSAIISSQILVSASTISVLILLYKV